ncbi:MAG: hypothetical protein OEU68_16630 [Nitrospira sp.]|nr:hypothetical protein [Nitrospira sp.]MDH4245804.1 hypothetical protein [Nitrospira sp.]MDH4357995.1 hypothetical protein [Nitrospira sp.]MDH5320255.1 hypothetical protein [Nitrospira sp.]
MSVEIGASYRTWLGAVSASVGARLALWGPDLAGIATIDLAVVEVDVKFGGDKAAPKPITAKAFRDRFLPAKDEELLSLVVSDGLIRSGIHEDVSLFVVNPAEFALEIESVIPKPDGTTIGIGPMGVTAARLGNKDVLTWTISKGGNPDWNFKEFFNPNDSKLLVKKPVPAALWGPAPDNGRVRAPRFKTDHRAVIDAVVGYTIKPNDEPKAGKSKKYDMDLFEANRDVWKKEQPTWPSDGPRFREQDTSVARVLTNISSTPPVHLLADLTGEDRDFASEVSLSTDWLADLQELPRVGTLETV